MLYNLLPEGPVISSSGSTPHWLSSSPQVEKGAIMVMREKPGKFHPPILVRTER